MTRVKLCTGCNTVWNVEDFNICRRNKDGRQARCRWCQREYYKEYIYPSIRGRGGLKDPWFSPLWTPERKYKTKRRKAS